MKLIFLSRRTQPLGKLLLVLSLTGALQSFADEPSLVSLVNPLQGTDSDRRLIRTAMNIPPSACRSR